MESDTLLLMRHYWRLDWRQTGERPLVRILRIGFLVVVGVTLAIISGFGGFGLGRLVAMPEAQLSISRGFIPGVLLTLVLLTVLITGPNQAVRALYLSDDLDQLVAAPIETRSILIAKLLSRLSWNIIFILLLAGPALATYGAGINAGLGYYVGAFILLFLAPLFGLSIGALIAMLLVRWLPAKRLGELLAAAYALLGITIGILFQLPRFFNVYGNMDDQTAETALNIAGKISSAPVPTLWAGQGLVDVGQGQVGLGLGRMAAYIVLTLGLFVFTVLVSDRLYLSGWLRMQGLSAKRKGLAEDGGHLRGGSLTTSIAAKDWLLRLRDPRQLVSLIGGAVIAIVVGALAIFRGSGGGDAGLLEASQSGAIDLPGQFSFISLVFSPGVIMAASVLFVGYAIFSQLALTSLALERQSYVVLKAAPITGTQVWRAKALGAWAPYAIVMTLLLVIAWIVVRFSILWGFYAWLCLLIMGIGLMAANTSLGFRFGNLDWTDTRRMTSGGGGLYSLVISTFYLLSTGLTAILFFVLANTFAGAAILFALLSIIIIGAGTAVWVWLMARWSENTWQRLGEG